MSSLAVGFAGAASVLVVVVLGTLATASGTGRGQAVLAAVLLGALPAAMYGVASAVFARFAAPALARAIERLGLRRFVDRDPSAPREPVILLHSAVMALVVGLGPMLVAGKLLMMRLRSVENEDLRELLALVGVTGLIASALLIALGLLWPLRRGFGAIDRRALLPLPGSPALRTVVWLGAPVCALAIGAIAFLEPVLGPLAAPLWLVLVIGVHVVVAAWVPRRSRAPWSRRGIAIAVLGVVLITVLGVAGANALLDSSPRGAAALESARPSRSLLSAARGLSDFDRDGASSLFGDRDCAPFSARRSPLARDIPGNGVDEDCDGKDQKKGSLPRSPTFYGDLKPEEIKGYDIVWFVVDAVRADYTSLLGYKRPTTARIDELAHESLVFENAFSQSSATMLSFPSMLTGVDPARVEWSREGKKLQVAKEQRRYISAMLESKGYQTGFVASAYIRKSLQGMLSAWEWTGSSRPGQNESSATAAAAATGFIHEARKKAAPFLLLTYLPAPHSPYVMHGPSYPKAGKSGAKRKYAAEIMNADRYIGFVLDVLRQDRERWAKTIVVFNSDHGEEFREHGGSTHASSCHVESTHVPLLVRVPGLPAMRVERPVQLIDIVPTLLELAGAADQGKHLEGSSLLLSARAPERIAADRPLFCTVVNQKAAQGSFARRSVRAGQWKLMTDIRSSKKPLLFDVHADPFENKPLPLDGEHAATTARLGGFLRAQLTGNVHLIDIADE